MQPVEVKDKMHKKCDILASKAQKNRRKPGETGKTHD
jgi:hypothetical protein